MAQVELGHFLLARTVAPVGDRGESFEVVLAGSARREEDEHGRRAARFDAREGGAFRISLTYDAPTETGKSTSRTDTYHGHFATLTPDEQVVEVLEFETTDPALAGVMTTTTLTDADGGTHVLVLHEGIPDGVPAAANEEGTRMALANLAALVEGG